MKEIIQKHTEDLIPDHQIDKIKEEILGRIMEVIDGEIRMTRLARKSDIGFMNDAMRLGDFSTVVGISNEINRKDGAEFFARTIRAKILDL